MKLHAVVVTVCFLLGTAIHGQVNSPDEKILRAAGIATDASPTLRRLLRDYTSPEPNETEVRDSIAAAIKKLE